MWVNIYIKYYFSKILKMKNQCVQNITNLIVLTRAPQLLSCKRYYEVMDEFNNK